MSGADAEATHARAALAAAEARRGPLAEGVGAAEAALEAAQAQVEAAAGALAACDREIGSLRPLAHREHNHQARGLSLLPVCLLRLSVSMSLSICLSVCVSVPASPPSPFALPSTPFPLSRSGALRLCEEVSLRRRVALTTAGVAADAGRRRAAAAGADFGRVCGRAGGEGPRLPGGERARGGGGQRGQ